MSNKVKDHKNQLTEQYFIDEVAKIMERHIEEDPKVYKQTFLKAFGSDPVRAIESYGAEIIMAETAKQLAERTLAWIKKAKSDDPEMIKKVYGTVEQPDTELEQILAGLKMARDEMTDELMRGIYHTQSTSPMWNTVRLAQQQITGDFIRDFQGLKGLITQIEYYLADKAKREAETA